MRCLRLDLHSCWFGWCISPALWSVTIHAQRDNLQLWGCESTNEMPSGPVCGGSGMCVLFCSWHNLDIDRSVLRCIIEIVFYHWPANLLNIKLSQEPVNSAFQTLETRRKQLVHVIVCHLAFTYIFSTCRGVKMKCSWVGVIWCD